MKNVFGNMNLKSIAILICLLVFVWGCNTKSKVREEASSQEKETARNNTEAKEEEIFEIDVEKVIQNSKSTKLLYSSFVKDIKYIPLETTNESLVGEKRHGIVQYVTEKRIIADMKIFDASNGRFISALSKHGQGPEEYTYIKGVAADDAREEFYIHDYAGSKIMVYDYNNHYKGTLAGLSGGGIIPLGKNNLLVDRFVDAARPYYDYFVTNAESKDILYKHVSSLLRESGDMNKCRGIVKSNLGDYVIMGSNKYWKYKGKLHYYEYLTDSLFVLNENFEPKPIGHLKMENLKMTEEQWRIPVSKADFYEWTISRFYETADALYIDVFGLNARQDAVKSYLIMYEKKGEKIVCYERPSYQNDIDFGIDVPLINFEKIYTSSGETSVYYFLKPEAIKEEIDKKGPSAYKSGAAKAFKDMGDKLKYDDNPVVCIMTLK